MPTSDLISIAVVVVLFSVLAIIIFSRSEKSSTKRHQQVASYRYRAEQAQEFHDRLCHIGLSKLVYQFLLQRVVMNFESALAIDNDYPGLKGRLDAAIEALANVETTQYYTELPADAVKLQNLITRLNKLIQYVTTLYQKQSIQDAVYQQLMPSLHQSMLRLTVEGNITVGHQYLNDGQIGTAKQCYSQAKSTLVAYSGEDAYVQEQLTVVDEYLLKVNNEEAEQLNPSQPKENKDDAIVSPDSDETEESQSIDDKIRDAVMDQAELNRLNEETGGHEVKKKW